MSVVPRCGVGAKRGRPRERGVGVGDGQGVVLGHFVFTDDLSRPGSRSYPRTTLHETSDSWPSLQGVESLAQRVACQVWV